MRRSLWIPVVALTAGCWQPRYFEPRENLTGTSPEGRPAAVYEVQRGDDDQARGQVRVWSDGAMARYDDDEQEVVDLHVALELENNGLVPLELDLESLQVEELYLNGYLQQVLAPASVEGSSRAEPGATARLDAVFRPATTYPREIDSFGLRFAVRDHGGGVVGQMTPFAPVPIRAFSGDAYWNNPSWNGSYWGGGPWGSYGSWGWGGGWGWSARWGGLRCR